MLDVIPLDSLDSFDSLYFDRVPRQTRVRSDQRIYPTGHIQFHCETASEGITKDSGHIILAKCTFPL